MPRETDTGKEAALPRVLSATARGLARFPRCALLVCLLLVAGALAFTAGGLQFKTSRADLLDPTSVYHQRWLRYVEEFGDGDDMVVVVRGPSARRQPGDSPPPDGAVQGPSSSHPSQPQPNGAPPGDDAAAITAVVDDLAGRIAERPQLFAPPFYRVDPEALRRHALLYYPAERLAALGSYLDQLQPILDGGWWMLNLRTLYEGIQLQFPQFADSAPNEHAPLCRQVEGMTRSLQRYLETGSEYVSPWPDVVPAEVAARFQPRYLLSNDGDFAFLLVRPAQAEQDFDGPDEAIAALRQMIDEAADRHPEYEIGLTGLPVLESDEMRWSQRDMLLASTLSAIGVGLLFVMVFRGVRYPLMLLAALGAGMAWAFAFATGAVGHLNILSITFASMVIGLGDFGTHYLARYLFERHQGSGVTDALGAAAAETGPGLVTAGLTMSLAFFSAVLTDFMGIAELGIIAGGGILLCLIANLLVLPPLVRLADRKTEQRRVILPFHVGRVLRAIHSRPRTVLVLCIPLFAALVYQAQHVRYDHNLLHLQAEGLDSVRWEYAIVHEADRSIWSAVSLASSPEEALALRERFEALPTVAHVEEVASMLPEDQEATLPLVRAIHARLAGLPASPPPPPAVEPRLLDEQLESLAARLQSLERSAGAADAGVSHGPSTALSEAIEGVRAQLAVLPLSEQYRRLEGFQNRLAADLHARFMTLRELATPEPVTARHLPPELAGRFVSPNGTWLLQVYANEDVWDIEPLGQFVADVRSVDPEATGKPLQTYEASLELRASYEQAAFYALVAVTLVVLLDFRSIVYAGLALLPPLLGLGLTLGIMGLIRLDVNPANLIVLPLLLGIGMDSGVYVVHDFRSQRGPYRIMPSTASAVWLTSLTTMVGFGSLMIAEHRGIASLGLVMFIGVGSCLVVSLVILPTLLRLVCTREAAQSGASDEAAPDEPQEPCTNQRSTAAYPGIRTIDRSHLETVRAAVRRTPHIRELRGVRRERRAKPAEPHERPL